MVVAQVVEQPHCVQTAHVRILGWSYAFLVHNSYQSILNGRQALPKNM